MKISRQLFSSMLIIAAILDAQLNCLQRYSISVHLQNLVKMENIALCKINSNETVNAAFQTQFQDKRFE